VHRVPVGLELKLRQRDRVKWPRFGVAGKLRDKPRAVRLHLDEASQPEVVNPRVVLQALRVEGTPTRSRVVRGFVGAPLRLVGSPPSLVGRCELLSLRIGIPTALSPCCNGPANSVALFEPRSVLSNESSDAK